MVVFGRGGGLGFFVFVFVFLLWLVVLSCRSGVPSMAFFDASPWHYESLLPTAAKVTQSAVLDLIALRVPAAFFEIILQRAALYVRPCTKR